MILANNKFTSVYFPTPIPGVINSFNKLDLSSNEISRVPDIILQSSNWTRAFDINFDYSYYSKSDAVGSISLSNNKMTGI
jgi:hypothetical protein